MQSSTIHRGYHTFNTNLVEGLPETRGISEGSFWSCAERSKARSYLRSLSDYSTGKASKDRASEMQKLLDGLSFVTSFLGLFIIRVAYCAEVPPRTQIGGNP